MHVFQPYPIESLEFNVFTRLKDDWGAITVEADGKVNTMTASWGTVGYLWNRNVVSIYVRRSHYTHEFLDKSDFFSLSFFDMTKSENRSALKIFGSVSGRDKDKIAGVHFNVNHKINIPFIDEANFVFLCHKLAKIPMDDPALFLDRSVMKNYTDGDFHDIYIGEVMEVLAR